MVKILSMVARAPSSIYQPNHQNHFDSSIIFWHSVNMLVVSLCSIETFYRRKAKVYSVHKIMMVFIKLLVQRNTGCVACHSLTHSLTRSPLQIESQKRKMILSNTGIHLQCTQYTYTNSYKKQKNKPRNEQNIHYNTMIQNWSRYFPIFVESFF